MVGTWIWVIFVILCGLCGVVAFAIMAETVAGKISGIVVCVVIAVAVSYFSLWNLYSTESGQRSVKSFKSNVSGGIERSVRVFDVEGDLLEEYTGRFDVDYDSSRIIFDDEEGKRHIIYYSTGTIIIDEV